MGRQRTRLFRLLCAFLGAFGSALHGVFGLVISLLGSAFRGVVGLLCARLHSVSRVLGSVLGFVPRFLHVLFRAVLARSERLTRCQAWDTYQGTSEQEGRQRSLHSHRKVDSSCARGVGFFWNQRT